MRKKRECCEVTKTKNVLVGFSEGTEMTGSRPVHGAGCLPSYNLVQRRIGGFLESCWSSVDTTSLKTVQVSVKEGSATGSKNLPEKGKASGQRQLCSSCPFN
jgi:hypothetical protein